MHHQLPNLLRQCYVSNVLRRLLQAFREFLRSMPERGSIRWSHRQILHRILHSRLQSLCLKNHLCHLQNRLLPPHWQHLQALHRQLWPMLRWCYVRRLQSNLFCSSSLVKHLLLVCCRWGLQVHWWRSLLQPLRRKLQSLCRLRYLLRVLCREVCTHAWKDLLRQQLQPRWAVYLK